MKNHYIFVEEDGSVSWSSNPRKLYREEGSTLASGDEIQLGDSEWKMVDLEGRLSVELSHRGQWVTTKGLQRGGLYKIQPKTVTTLMSKAARGEKEFEPANRVPATAST